MPKSSKSKSTSSNTKTNKKATCNPCKELVAPKPCDRCRKHRIKCNRDLEQCNHCKSNGISCTYLDVPKKRGPRSKVEKDVTTYFNIIKERRDENNTYQTMSTREQTRTWAKAPSPSDQSAILSVPYLVPINSFHSSFGSEPNYNTDTFGYFNLTSGIPSIFNEDNYQAFVQNQYAYLTPKICTNDTLIRLGYTTNYYHFSTFEQLPTTTSDTPNLWLNVPTAKWH